MSHNSNQYSTNQGRNVNVLTRQTIGQKRRVVENLDAYSLQPPTKKRKVNTKTARGRGGRRTRSREESSLRNLAKKFVELIGEMDDGVMDLNESASTLDVPKRRIYDITNVLEGIGLIEKKSKNLIKWRGSPAGLNSTLAEEVENKMREEESLKVPKPPEVGKSGVKKEKSVRSDGSVDIKLLEHEVKSLKQMNETLGGQINTHREDIEKMTQDEENQKKSFVTYTDICSLPNLVGRTVIAIKAPPFTTLTVPDPSHEMNMLAQDMRRYQIYLESEGGPISVYLLSEDVEAEHKVHPATGQPLTAPSVVGGGQNENILEPSLKATTTTGSTIDQNNNNDNLVPPPPVPPPPSLSATSASTTGMVDGESTTTASKNIEDVAEESEDDGSSLLSRRLSPSPSKFDTTTAPSLVEEGVIVDDDVTMFASRMETPKKLQRKRSKSPETPLKRQHQENLRNALKLLGSPPRTPIRVEGGHSIISQGKLVSTPNRPPTNLMNTPTKLRNKHLYHQQQKLRKQQQQLERPPPLSLIKPPEKDPDYYYSFGDNEGISDLF